MSDKMPDEMGLAQLKKGCGIPNEMIAINDCKISYLDNGKMWIRPGDDNHLYARLEAAEKAIINLDKDLQDMLDATFNLKGLKTGAQIEHKQAIYKAKSRTSLEDKND